jgi:hypothetical protein
MTTLLESIFLDKLLSDKQRLKLLSIAWRHDPDIDIHVVSKLGPRPTEQDIATAWDLMLDKKLNELGEPELIADSKYKEWLTKLYVTGRHHSDSLLNNLEHLESWHVLSLKNLLKPEHTDLNRIRSVEILERIVSGYHAVLVKIKAERELEKLKRNVQQIILIDNERFFVAIPLNYAACYSFNYTGHNSRYCTGASDGRGYFSRYSSNGPIVTIIDKKNLTDKNGKWQLHPATGQFANSDQTVTSASADRQFAKQYPGLYKEIVSAIQAKSADIQQSSMLLSDRGYNMPSIIKKFATEFPISYKSVPVSEQMLAEASNLLTQFRDLPGAKPMITGMLEKGRLSHNAKITTVSKLEIKNLRDKIRRGSSVNFVIFIRGTQDLGIISMGNYTNSAYVYQDTLLTQQDDSIAQLLTWLKQYIGKVVDYSIVQSPSQPVQNVRNKRATLKPRPETSDPQTVATILIAKLKPLIARNVERAIADIKGFINTLIKHSNYNQANEKIAILKNLENQLEHMQLTQTYDNKLVTAKMINAIHSAALYHYPELTQDFSDRESRIYTGGYNSDTVAYQPVLNTDGVKQLMKDIKNGDTQKVGTILSFFRHELVKTR